MKKSIKNALNGGANTEEGEGVEILRAEVDPQANHTTPAGVVSMRSLGGAGDGDAIQGEELAGMERQRTSDREAVSRWTSTMF